MKTDFVLYYFTLAHGRHTCSGFTDSLDFGNDVKSKTQQPPNAKY